MPDPADVSVIICTRNRPAFLSKALAAVAAATPSEVEVIVVDSGSDTDETRVIAEAAEVAYLRSVRGLSIARNAGLAASGRPIVVFTDDDCLPEEGWIAHALRHFADDGVGAVTGHMLDHRVERTPGSLRRRRYQEPQDGIDAGHGAVMAFRRQLLLRLGGFDDVMGAGQLLAGAEDLDIFVRILRAGSAIVFDPACLVTHANTRVGDEYIALHEGYGLGLGALVTKWLRLDPVFGARLGCRLIGRAVARVLRARLRGAHGAHDLALLRGLAAGVRVTWGVPIVGERYVVGGGAAPAVSSSDGKGDGMTVTRDAATVPATVPATAPARVPATAPARVELLRILDETHIATSIAFEAMHTGAVLILDGAPVTGPDGLLDRERLLRAAAAGIRRVPELGLRVVDVPFGLTAPAWVPDPGFDVRHHVHFDDEPHDLSGDRLRWLTEQDRGTFPKDRPLWDMTFTRLTTGEVAMGARLHHASGDAKWAFETLTEVTDPSPEAVALAETPPPVAAPPPAFVIPFLALRRWLHEQPSAAAAWREYWRKPVLKRVKRMGGRNIRPFKEYMIRRRGLRAVFLPPVSQAFFTVDASATARRAAKLRGSVNDLLVAGTMGAVDGDARGIDVLVPVSRRTKADRAVRNHVRITRVHGAPDLDLAGRVSSVRAQVTAFATGRSREPAPEGRGVGYATTVEWSSERRFFAGAEVRTIYVMPAADHRDEMSAFAAVYADHITVTVTTRAELDTEGNAGRLREALVGASG